MNRRLLAGAAATVLASATGASAQTGFNPTALIGGGQFYAGADGGYHFPQTFRPKGTSNTDGAGRKFDFGTDTSTNWAAFGRIGYEHPTGIRAEFEYAFRNGDLDSIHGQANGVQPFALCTPGGAAGCSNVKGSLNVSSVMFNLLYDFKGIPYVGDFPIRPFIGAGAGGAFVHTKAYGQQQLTAGGYAPATTSFDDDKSAFAWQGLAGFTWNVHPNIAIDLTGRYFIADRVRAPSVSAGFNNPAGAGVYDLGTFKGEYRDASVSLGLRYMFGGHTAPPPPPPPPPPPAPPPPPPEATAPAAPATPDARQFVVYFPFDQSILTTDAQAVVQAAANYAGQGHATRIVVVGHTDTSGSARYNVRLSERRARTVADALVGLGVDQQALAVDWKGEADPAVSTGDGVKEPLNRRATIDINFQ